MKIIYIGGGYVGACSAAVSADSGHQVLVYDINSELIKKLSSLDKDIIESVLFEENLGELIIRNRARIKFSDKIDDIKEFIDETDAIFMCLPTPEKDKTGETDLSYYEKAAKNIADILANRNNNAQNKYILIINKSTVPVHTINRLKEIMDESGVINYGIGANPEFLVEGKAVSGSIKPQRIVVGAWQEKDFIILREIYRRFEDSPNVSFIEINPAEAIAGKLLANYMLFNRLANCFDVVGRVCEKFDEISFENVRKILITDKRIGDWGFYNSLFAGGSCFIKDARSLAHQLKSRNAEVDLINDTLSANLRQLNNFLNRAEKELNFNWQGARVGLLGLAFKRSTNDIRNSAAIGTVDFLIDRGVSSIKAYDPAAGENFLKYFNGKNVNLILNNSEDEVMAGTDALIICSDWPQFRELFGKIKEKLPKSALIMDGRRMLQAQYGALSQSGYNIIAVGSPLIKAV